MSGKYIDLTNQIRREIGGNLAPTVNVLRWLDEHPDQVPGRTITQTRLVVALTGEGQNLSLDHYYRVFERLGITVVPEPTIPLPTEPGVQFIAHSSKLSDDPEDQREFVIAGQYIVALDSAAMYSRELFEDAGWTVTALVTAPGTSDDQ